MECNYIQHNGGSDPLKLPKIKHVQGNVLRLAIPLTLRIVELVDGEMQHTDTDFNPSSEHPVNVVFEKTGKRITIPATMRDGNIATIEDKGKMPVGTYDISVTCYDDNGNPYRFKQKTVLLVVDATAEADILPNTEFEVTTWYLDAAIFLALKGEDGVGIADITTQSSSEIGGMNIVTITLTDGRVRTFTILNGSGAVDDELNINSPSPISNRAVTEKFNEVDENLGNVFGNVDYNSTNKSIRFWDKDKTRILANLDARPFIKDGMVNNVYISNNTLVITFNTDSGREAIGVPLSSVFNPNNYYNKTQVDNRIAQAVADVQIDTSGLAKLEATTSKLKHGQASTVVLDAIVLDQDAPPVEQDAGIIYGEYNGHIIACVQGRSDVERYDLGVVPHLVFTNKEDNKMYRWTGSAWQQVGGSNGINATYDPINERIIFPTGSAVVVNERLIITT